jgi:uncharacterized protein YbbK (DUF523 family)
MRTAATHGRDLRPWQEGRRIAQHGSMSRAEQFREQLADARGGRVIFLSHCLLNQNVHYLGGAGRAGGVSEVVEGYLGRGVGICQLPCPEQRAWGGVLKRRMLLAYGSAGTLRAPAVRLLLRPFTWYTRRVYARLACAITREVLDYRRCGVKVAGVVGIGGSPSCGVATTLDLPAAVGALTRCPAARLDRRALNQNIVAANVRPARACSSAPCAGIWPEPVPTSRWMNTTCSPNSESALPWQGKPGKRPMGSMVAAADRRPRSSGREPVQVSAGWRLAGLLAAD